MAIRILIADDNALVRHALGQALTETRRREIIEAENGEQAILKAIETQPHLIILDLAMPVMDGIRAARAISHAQPTIPIILHTLHWSPRVAVEALKAGVRKVVAKSDSATILAAVDEMLEPELLGYTATVMEPWATPQADITVIRPASIRPASALSELSAAKKQAKGCDQPGRGGSDPKDR